jgi:serine/threonine protein phosphatase 1
MRYFIVGDIHGMADHLSQIINMLDQTMVDDDIAVFCGDYIDRGVDSFQVVELLIAFEKRHKAIFLMGNHEVMLFQYLQGGSNERTLYLINGGGATIRSYTNQFGGLYIPESHKKILFSEKYYFEAETFIVVHAGLNPEYSEIKDNDPSEMIWIREKFYRAEKKWPKTIVFGHTPTHYIGMPLGVPYRDPLRNIIGIDTGAVYAGRLTCLEIPGMKLMQSLK